MDRQHYYQVTVRWTGNRSAGTSSYLLLTAYDRNTELQADGKDAIKMSADPAFRGHGSR